jgi:hypothetical protein
MPGRRGPGVIRDREEFRPGGSGVCAERVDHVWPLVVGDPDPVRVLVMETVSGGTPVPGAPPPVCLVHCPSLVGHRPATAIRWVDRCQAATGFPQKLSTGGQGFT